MELVAHVIHGMKEAKGKYIMFVDSDDTIFQEVLNQDLLKNDYDFIIFNSVTLRNENETRINKVFNGDSGKIKHERLLEKLLKTEALNSPWAKLYKKDFLQSNNILFNEKMVQGEDAFFNLLCAECNPKTYYVDKTVYGYYFENINTKKRWINKFDSALYGTCLLFEKRIEIANRLDENRKKDVLKIINKNFIKTYRRVYILMIREKDLNKVEFLSNNLNIININVEYLSFSDRIIFYLLKKNKYRIIYFLHKLKKINN